MASYNCTGCRGNDSFNDPKTKPHGNVVSVPSISEFIKLPKRIKTAASAIAIQTLSISHINDNLRLFATKNKPTGIANAAPWLDKPPIPVNSPFLKGKNISKG